MGPAEIGFRLHQGCIETSLVEKLKEELELSHRPDKKAGFRDGLAKSPLLHAMVEDAFGLRDRLFGQREVDLLRCIVFDKNASANWHLGWHQDLNIKRADGVTLPWERLPEVVTLRLHLDPTPAENGALRVLPGSHREGVLRDEQRRALTIEEFVVEAEPGDLLEMCLLVHASSPSLLPTRRRVVHVDLLAR